LFDSIKKATGIGLTYGEHYQRAYEKGVLLGPAKYAEAVQLFEAAAKKAGEANDQETQARALANARLYGFITTGNAGLLPELRRCISYFEQMEAIGSQSEGMPTAPLAIEIDGRLAEAAVGAVSEDDHAARAAAHQQAGELFRQIYHQPLITYRYQKADQHTATGGSRYLLHTGLACWHRALHVVLTEPEGAAEEMGKALAAFRNCQDDDWAGRAQSWLTLCRVRRTCWLCHRESQGAGVHFESYAARVTPYVVALVARLGQDASSIDLGAGSIILCKTCGSAVECIADAYAGRHADAVREEVMGRLGQLATSLEYVARRVENLEARMIFRS
jgi:hypothetical protein